MDYLIAKLVVRSMIDVVVHYLVSW